jgi:DNA processing protein
VRCGRAADDRREQAARLALIATPGLPASQVIALVETCGSAVRALDAIEHEFGAEVATALHSDAVRERVRRALHAVEANSIRVVAFDDADYPPTLRERLDAHAPSLLFALGDLGLTRQVGVAVVGSRRATDYGIDVASQVAEAAVRAGACVISGLALGIDAAAHEAALGAGGRTIAVLGCGVDVYYPRRNTTLQDDIAREGLLLSELLPGEPPRKPQFPHRNRIIAALSRCVVVVEAGIRSGAISTATHAMKQAVDVYAVPGRVDEPNVQGVLGLLRDGVPPFTGIRDLLESAKLLDLGAALPPAARPVPAGPGGALWSALTTRPVHIDRIARHAGLTAGAALTGLLQLELDGLVVQLPGGRFRRARRRNRNGDAG